ncbi:hypothetical protein [Herpetosiphon giganteus]|uniref:hypothetical protein n=1 Tax=Herpetosiphon giganteus TaxID=2029754 RepID=UPI0019569244|nr:hypothetical protein [Herpetosiphon giganteus]MBM7846246.1 hypothetical protein [Herpetosiphon giganteus]
MYTIFDTDMVKYRRKTLTAECLNLPPLDIHKAWQYADPLVPLAYPEVLEFVVHSVPNMPDSYWNASGFLLIHQRLAAILNAFDTPHEAYPVVLRDKRTKDVLPQSEDYVVYRILETASIIDPQCAKGADRDTPYQLNPALPSDLPPVFRDTIFRSLIFVHDHVRAAIEAQAMTGCRFFTVDEFNQEFRFPLTAAPPANE